MYQCGSKLIFGSKWIQQTVWKTVRNNILYHNQCGSKLIFGSKWIQRKMFEKRLETTYYIISSYYIFYISSLLDSKIVDSGSNLIHAGAYGPVFHYWRKNNVETMSLLDHERKKQCHYGSRLLTLIEWYQTFPLYHAGHVMS